MEIEKPIKLIGLLIKLKTDVDKTKYQRIYIDIAKEIMSLEFEHNTKEPLQSLVYKKYIQLSVKDFIYSGQTEDSLKNLDEVIELLKTTSILNR